MLAVIDTATTIPALIGMQNGGRVALHGIGDKHVHLAHVHTGIASLADIRIEGDG
jgi:hypothetical protein